MPWGIDEIELVSFAVERFVIERHALRFNGNAALALQVHRVENLRRHLAIGQATTDLNQAVRERRFTMVNVRDDGEVSYVLHLYEYLHVEKQLRT